MVIENNNGGHRINHMGILVCGLNGSGKSTLGRMLAEKMGYIFIDNEELYFPKEDPAYEYTGPRNKQEVIRLLEEKIQENRCFVFAAVRGDYGDKLLTAIDCTVSIDVPKEVRMQRVYERSLRKFGARMLEGGDLYDREAEFFGIVKARPDDYVNAWLSELSCPVINIDGTRPLEENLAYLLSVLNWNNGIQQA